MKKLTTILALFGSVWALSGLGGLIMTLGSLEYIETGLDLLKFFATMILLISGYYVWWGWVFYSFKERFPFVSSQTFWFISFVHHVCCVIYLMPLDVWGGGDDPWWIPAWVISNVVIATYILVSKPRLKESSVTVCSLVNIDAQRIDYQNFSSDGKTRNEWALEWNDISKIEVFKRDMVCYDLICMSISYKSGECMEVDEESALWDKLIEMIPIKLSEVLPISEWFFDVALPPFDTNLKVIYNNNDG